MAKITSLAQPKPSLVRVRSAISFRICPRRAIASILMPAAVVPTFTDEQTRLVVESTSGRLSISVAAAGGVPFCASAE